MPLLLFQAGSHEQRQNLVEQASSTKIPGLFRDNTHGCPSSLRSSVFNAEQESQYFTFF